MAKIEFELNSDGVKYFLNCEKLQNYMQPIGNRVAREAGVGYAADTRAGKRRAHTFVKAITAHAYYSNLKHNSLLKALHP